MDQFVPVKEPFMNISHCIIPRQSTYVSRSSLNSSLQNLNEQPYLIFNVLLLRYGMFKSQLWKPFELVLELVENCNLWSVTIQTEESIMMNKTSEEAFLLQALDYMIVGQAED